MKINAAFSCLPLARIISWLQGEHLCCTRYTVRGSYTQVSRDRMFPLSRVPNQLPNQLSRETPALLATRRIPRPLN